MIPIIKEMSEHRRTITVIFQRIDFSPVSSALADSVISNIAMNQYPQWIKKHSIDSGIISEYMKRAVSSSLVSTFMDVLSHSQYPEFVQLATEMGITSDIATLGYKLSSQWRVPQDVANIIQQALSPVLLDDGSVVLSLPSDLDRQNITSYLSQMALSDKDYGIISYLSPATIKLAVQSGSRNVLTMIAPSISMNHNGNTVDVASKLDEIRRSFSKLDDKSATTLRAAFKGDDLASNILSGATVGKDKDGQPKLRILSASITAASDSISSQPVDDSTFFYPENKESLIGYGVPHGAIYTTLASAIQYTMYNRTKLNLSSSEIIGSISSTFEHDYGQYRVPSDSNYKFMLYETWRNVK